MRAGSAVLVARTGAVCVAFGVLGRRALSAAGAGAGLIALPEGGGGIAAAALPVPVSVSLSLSVSVSVLLSSLLPALPPPALVSASGADAALPGGGNGTELAVSVVGGYRARRLGPRHHVSRHAGFFLDRFFKLDAFRYSASRPWLFARLRAWRHSPGYTP